MLLHVITRKHVEVTVTRTEEMGTARVKPCSFWVKPTFNLLPVTKCQDTDNSEGLKRPRCFTILPHILTQHPCTKWVIPIIISIIFGPPWKVILLSKPIFHHFIGSVSEQQHWRPNWRGSVTVCKWPTMAVRSSPVVCNRCSIIRIPSAHQTSTLAA